jgi:cytochrome b561
MFIAPYRFSFHWNKGASILSGALHVVIGSAMESNSTSILFRPATGSALAFSAGLSFYLLCMIMPLVGPAGSRVEHHGRNLAAFLFVLFLTFALSGAASWSKLECRKVQGGALPWFSLGLCALCLLTLIVLLFKGFAI